ncbi:1-acyl-sn-glycerol-3-phosphate acyltransferase [Collibacillus ludicampi]|jgi:1-acyl-sn-glycerol-3-phosphate acyltransferase|uniref:1-acyl-sn-glycerol-3-phosphate acyltransferase n=1 Tax=Collibacillus ludicampi TaxID=2771369 RepID=A0AAV4LK95_9BACL|nr:lysophospholipid acyltransferase family protein [Collibacillus ludicampi]GIM48214.1 1-acyl-sn-glycerol-3-phosphate acyltransferase [Collibacillus ludicampi]
MLYVAFRSLFRLLFKVVYRWRIEGRENVPTSGAVVVCSNHISLLDPPLLGASLERQVFFMAKEELFRIPVISFLIRRFGAFPVKRGAGDRAALRTALSILQRGDVLGIFPEGTRSKTGRLGKPQSGVSLLAIKGNAVVVPAAIIGPFRMFRPIRIVFGKPIDLSQYRDQKLTSAFLDEVSLKIMDEIRALMETRD